MPSTHVSLPRHDYVKASAIADELGVPLGALIRTAVLNYLKHYETGGVSEAVSQQAENICQECLSPIPGNIPMRVWPGDRGPFCSLRCAGGEDLIKVMRNGDTCITKDGRTGSFVEAGSYTYNRTVTCQACGSPVSPDEPRVKVPPRYYFCALCTTPVEVADLLELPPVGTAQDILAVLKRHQEGTGR